MSIINCMLIEAGRLVAKYECNHVFLPAEGGLMQVLPRHENYVVPLLSGVINIGHSSKKRYFSRKGIAVINQNSVSILTNMLINLEHPHKQTIIDIIEKLDKDLKAQPQTASAITNKKDFYKELLARKEIWH